MGGGQAAWARPAGGQPRPAPGSQSPALRDEDILPQAWSQSGSGSYGCGAWDTVRSPQVTRLRAPGRVWRPGLAGPLPASCSPRCLGGGGGAAPGVGRKTGGTEGRRKPGSHRQAPGWGGGLQPGGSGSGAPWGHTGALEDSRGQPRRGQAGAEGPPAGHTQASRRQAREEKAAASGTASAGRASSPGARRPLQAAAGAGAWTKEGGRAPGLATAPSAGRGAGFLGAGGWGVRRGSPTPLSSGQHWVPVCGRGNGDASGESHREASSAPGGESGRGQGAAHVFGAEILGNELPLPQESSFRGVVAFKP